MLGNFQARKSKETEKYMCSTEEKLDVSRPIRSVKCAVVFNVLYKRSQCVSVLWSYALPGPYGAGEDLSPSTQGTPPLPGHWEFSLLAASKKDESGWCGGHS